MTQFNQIGETGLAEVLTRRLTTPGGSNAPAVAPEVFPVLTLESDRIEWGYLKGEIPYARTVAAAASGGAGFSGLEIWNPVGSKILVVIKQIWMVGQSAGGVRIGTSISPTALVGTAVYGVARDTRWGSAAAIRQSAAIVTTATNYTSPAALPNLLGGAFAETFEYREGIILAPGGLLYIIGDTANTAINRVNLSWTERGAQPGELA